MGHYGIKDRVRVTEAAPLITGCGLVPYGKIKTGCGVVPYGKIRQGAV